MNDDCSTISYTAAAKMADAVSSSEWPAGAIGTTSFESPSAAVAHATVLAAGRSRRRKAPPVGPLLLFALFIAHQTPPTKKNQCPLASRYYKH